MMYAVGEDDGVGWIAVDAPSEEAARRAYCDEWRDAHEPIPDFVIAERVSAWDGLDREPTGAEWVNAGLSYRCAKGCGVMVHLDGGGVIILGEPVCLECAQVIAEPQA